MTLRGHRNFVTSIDASPNDNYSLAEGGGSVSEAVYVVERETQKGGKQQKKRADVPGAGVKVFAAVWDKHWGIVSGGEDKQVQINKGSDLLLPKA
ncbi:hypothetical protein G7054_g12360 [Neopestalotiopsis clavispora]|nr:hypothetical protein G7054_g12360 [Neopestalotiopsis clavispora]